MESKETRGREAIDAMGRKPERIAAFTGQLLEEQEDRLLQQIVKEAAEDLSTPMALVNFVMEQIQFFKAHHGLPEDLAFARGTDRSVSFCQFVVRDGVPFEVEDAETDDRVPKHLVKNYSIRSYLGMPIKANGTIIGSLCVIDTKPRKFSAVEKHKLKTLATSVNKRLAILSEHRWKPNLLRGQQNKHNALEELENTLQPIEEDIMVGRSSHTALSAFMRLMEFNGSTPSAIALNHSVIMQTMKAAGEALVDASDRLFAIDMSLNRAKGLIGIVRSLVEFKTRCRLSGILSESADLMEDLLEAAGGINIIPSQQQYEVYIERRPAVLFCSTAISLIAGAMLKAQSNGGIAFATEEESDFIVVTITAALSPTALSAICHKLDAQTANLNLTISKAVDDRKLKLQFHRPPDQNL